MRRRRHTARTIRHNSSSQTRLITRRQRRRNSTRRPRYQHNFRTNSRQHKLASNGHHTRHTRRRHTISSNLQVTPHRRANNSSNIRRLTITTRFQDSTLHGTLQLQNPQLQHLHDTVVTALTKGRRAHTSASSRRTTSHRGNRLRPYMVLRRPTSTRGTKRQRQRIRGRRSRHNRRHATTQLNRHQVSSRRVLRASQHRVHRSRHRPLRGRSRAHLLSVRACLINYGRPDRGRPGHSFYGHEGGLCSTGGGMVDIVLCEYYCGERPTGD